MSRSYQLIFMIPYHRFLNGSTVGILGWTVCCGEGVCPMPFVVFSSIPNICPLDTSSTPHTPQYDNQKISPDIAKCPWKGKLPAG